MSVVAEDLVTSPLFATLSEDQRAVVASCASRVTHAPDQVVFRVGGDADAVEIIQSGRVALQLHPASGDPLLIKTVGAGDVLGVSWMLPPYRWTLDAVAVEETQAVSIDAVCLRAACDADPVLGYALHRAFAGLVGERLVGARLQLLDLYGHRGR